MQTVFIIYVLKFILIDVFAMNFRISGTNSKKLHQNEINLLYFIAYKNILIFVKVLSICKLIINPIKV